MVTAPGVITAYDNRFNVLHVNIQRGGEYYTQKDGIPTWNQFESRNYRNPTPSSMGRVFWAIMKVYERSLECTKKLS